MATQQQDWLDTGARMGYAVKGALYVIIGALSVQVATGSGGETTGSRGAIETIATQPYGQVLLWLTALGLVGYAAWRVIEAIQDPNREGTDTEGLVKRTGFFVSGLIHAGLAIFAVRLATGSGSGGGDTREDVTATLLEQPFGQWLVGAVGVIVIGIALYQFYKAFSGGLLKNYHTHQMSQTEQDVARRLAQAGLSARGVTFGIIAFFVIVVAIQSNPDQTRGLSGALDALADQPYGPWLLGLVALGLVAYGLYCFSKAWYYHFKTEHV